MQHHILVLSGPNLNLLGTREPHLYGKQTLEDIHKTLKSMTTHAIHCFQSNAEHTLIERIHQACEEKIDFILINPAAYGHTSIALRDALLAVNIPFIELHLTNTQTREPFRHTSFLADIAVGTLQGFGAYSYTLALLAALQHLDRNH